jgi:ribosomal protein S18 acetylase RimI-like enzyme
LRPAREDEAAAVAALVESAFSRHVEAVGRRPAPMDDDHAARIAAGEQWVRDAGDGGLASSIVLVDAGDHLIVNNVAVSPAFQGRGLGRELLAFAEAEARRRGLSEIRLHTNAAMADNIAMYPRLGYTETGRETRHGFHRVLFVKAL